MDQDCAGGDEMENCGDQHTKGGAPCMSSVEFEEEVRRGAVIPEDSGREEGEQENQPDESAREGAAVVVKEKISANEGEEAEIKSGEHEEVVSFSVEEGEEREDGGGADGEDAD